MYFGCYDSVRLSSSLSTATLKFSSHLARDPTPQDSQPPRVFSEVIRLPSPQIVKEEPQERMLPALVPSAVTAASTASDTLPKKGKRRGRTAEDRLRAFQADTRCKCIEPSQALCRFCNKWIQLNREVPYVDSNWLRHVERCEKKMRYVSILRASFHCWTSFALQWRRTQIFIRQGGSGPPGT